MNYVFMAAIGLHSAASARFPFPSASVGGDSGELSAELGRVLRRCDESQRSTQLGRVPGAATACDGVRFLSSILDRERENAARSRERTDAAISGEARREVTVRSDADLPFGDFFLEFEMKQEALLVQDFPDLMESKKGVQALLGCVSNAIDYKNIPTTNVTLGEALQCPECDDLNGIISLMEKSRTFSALTNAGAAETQDKGGFVPIVDANACPILSFPKYVANDYLRKMQGTRYENLRRVYSDFSVQVRHLSPSEIISPSVASCPASLHGMYTVLGGLGDSGSNIETRIFDFIDEPSLKPSIEIKSEVPRHTIFYENDGWDTKASNYRGIDLGQGSALFVPSSSGPITFRVSESEYWNEVLLLRFCFLDASNFNEFKSHLLSESIVDPLAEEVLEILSHPTFDVAMIRDVPSTTAWSYAFNAQAADPNAENHVGDTPSVGTGRRLNRDRRKRGSFSEWQLGKSWENRVIGLTLPIMSTPEVIGHGRRNVTLSWLCPFTKKDGDSTAVGYVVSWEGYGASGAPMLKGNMTFELSEDLSPGFSVEYATDKKARSYGVQMRNITVIINNLESNSYYSFKAALYYGNDERDRSQSPFSAASELVLTDPPSFPFPVSSPPMVVDPGDWNVVLGKKKVFTPAHGSDATLVVLEFRAPHDDGGLVLTGYDVMRTHEDPSGHKSGEWVLLSYGVEELSNEEQAGGLVRLNVHNLIPGGSYKFKVAAKNSMGRGVWSASSNVGTTVSYSQSTLKSGRRLNSNGHGFIPDVGHVLHGHGSNGLSSPEGHVRHGPLVMLNDFEQVIKMNGLTGALDVWSGHWSPRSFIVKAETSDVEWDLSGEVMNKESVEYRIAVIERSEGTPFANMALAAQRAGALAVIFVDSGGCDKFDQYCILGSSKVEGDFWGEHDLSTAWENLLIPVVFALPEGPHGSTHNLLHPKKQ